jgi:hypothetical protein
VPRIPLFRSGSGGGVAPRLILHARTVLGGLAVYARIAILDTDAFTQRAVATLTSDEVDEELADRLTVRLVDHQPALLRFQPVIEYEARELTASPVVLTARELVVDLAVVSLAGALLYRGVQQLTRLAVR